MAEISNQMYEELREILEKQNGRAYTFEEAKEIGDGLIDFYRTLMELSSEEEEAAEPWETDRNYEGQDLSYMREYLELRISKAGNVPSSTSDTFTFMLGISRLPYV